MTDSVSLARANPTQLATLSFGFQKAIHWYETRHKPETVSSQHYFTSCTQLRRNDLMIVVCDSDEQPTWALFTVTHADRNGVAVANIDDMETVVLQGLNWRRARKMKAEATAPAAEGPWQVKRGFGGYQPYNTETDEIGGEPTNKAEAEAEVARLNSEAIAEAA